MKQLYLALRIAAFVALITLCLTGQTKKYEYSKRDKAFYADPALVDFVRPGLAITINSAKISNSGVISVTYTLTDGNELLVEYHATTDKATPINLSQHSYFNLTGATRDVLDHEIRRRFGILIAKASGHESNYVV